MLKGDISGWRDATKGVTQGISLGTNLLFNVSLMALAWILGVY